jgi:molecular chaperone DnaK (HSP70)
LGGEDFDQRLMDHLIAVFEKKNPGLGDAVRKSNRALQRLRRQCEIAKRSLSSQTSAAIEVRSLI